MTSTAVGELASWEVPSPRASVDRQTIDLWPSIFADHMYGAVAQALAVEHRVILVDGPGHGASGPPPVEGFTMAQCAAALKAVLDARGVRDAVVGGTSWGGLVGSEFAIAYPQRLPTACSRCRTFVRRAWAKTAKSGRAAISSMRP